MADDDSAVADEAEKEAEEDAGDDGKDNKDSGNKDSGRGRGQFWRNPAGRPSGGTLFIIIACIIAFFDNKFSGIHAHRAGKFYFTGFGGRKFYDILTFFKSAAKAILPNHNTGSTSKRIGRSNDPFNRLALFNSENIGAIAIGALSHSDNLWFSDTLNF